MVAVHLMMKGNGPMLLTVTHDIFYDLTAEYFMQCYSFFLLKPSISAPRGASWGRGGAIFPAKDLRPSRLRLHALMSTDV